MGDRKILYRLRSTAFNLFKGGLMKTALTVISALFLSVNFLYARDFGEFSLDSERISESLPVPSAPEADKTVALPEMKPLPVKEWTVMVFLNGKNNLEGAAISDINEMEKVGSSDKVNILVEAGRMKGYDSSNGDWTGAKIFYIKSDFIGKWFGGRTIRAREVASFDKINMGDYKEVINFASWAKKNFPARKYLLVLWDHGSGWERGNPVEDKGISDDEETGNNIDTPQIAKIMEKVGDVEVLAFDACLMQMAEVLYELKDSKAKFITASEETEPGSGYPYDKILSKLVGDPGMAGDRLSRIIVDEYMSSVWDPDATHSAIKMSAAADLGGKMDVFAKAAMDSKEKEVIRESVLAARKYGPYNTRKYGRLLHRDLKHFADLVTAKTKNDALKAAARDLSGFIAEGKLLVKNKAKKADSNGVAVNMDILSADYPSLKISKDTKWCDFVLWAK